MFKTTVLFCLFVISNALFAQQLPEEFAAKQKSANDALITRLNQRQSNDYSLAVEKAKRFNIELRQVSKYTGVISEFAGFAGNGQMLFNITDNVGSGKSISTNKVWPGGTVGTALKGNLTGNRLGEWDGGAVRLTHQEFGGRVVQVDGATTLSDHATHVAGTMMAAGVDAKAKGMAYEANLRAYDWNSDETEMAQAGAAGMLVSNHSYGTITGWYYNDNTTPARDEWYGDISLSNQEDYKFGFYDFQAKDWDDIAANNPFYLICKAAGNDRGDNVSGSTWFVRNSNGVFQQGTGTPPPADGQYDCISTNGVAKNILTVGAVNKIGNSDNNNGYVNAAGVVMSSFSGWGPTDDGRIKPDVVAAGVNLYSSFSTSNTAYSSISGTSMATPSVTGSLLLVQQHHFNVKGRFMRSATLKGLAIHTADEAGTAAGPDYQFGWGLLNTAKAVRHVTDSGTNLMVEQVLANSATYSFVVNNDGTAPLKATLCWTDKSGNPVTESLDPTNSMLVHNLDLRVKRNSDNQVFLPYALNPLSPASAATTADNNRDNVEQILLASPTAGSYTITISHKGTLSPNQAFSVLVSGVIASKPVASMGVNSNSICSNKSVTFSDQSTPAATSRRWYFPGGSPSTSTSATVVVTYPTVGEFPVALSVSNSLGSDSVYNANFIKVGGSVLPFTENFESKTLSQGKWTLSNPDNDTTWRLAQLSIGGGQFNTAAVVPNYNYNAAGQRDGLVTQVLSLNGLSSASLSFKQAYGPYSGNTQQDSLIVYISTNCGTSWIRLASYGQALLSTAASSQNEFIPSATDWCPTLNACKTISLNSYVGQQNLQFKFENYCAYANNLYIDDISFTGVALKPVAKFGANPTSVCANNNFTLIDSSSNNPTNWSWTITGPESKTGNQKNFITNLSLPGVYTVKLVVTNTGGSDSLTKTNYLTVLPSPNKPNLNSSKGLQLCQGDSTLLSTDSISSSYQWRLDNMVLGGSASNNSFNAKASGSYTIALIGGNNCQRVSDPMVLNFSPKPGAPVVTSSALNNSFCEGGTVILTSSADNGNIWYKDNVLIPNGSTKTINTTAPGNFSTEVSFSGCKSDRSSDLVLTMRPKPTTSPITGPANSFYRAIETYTVTGSVGSSFGWNVTGGIIQSGSGSNSVSVKWGNLGTGNVSVLETSSTGCLGDNKLMSVSLSPPVGIEQLDFVSGIHSFPNPVVNDLTLLFNNGSAEPVNIQLVDILGKVVYATNVIVDAHDKQTIDMSTYKSGIYFIEIKCKQGNKQLRVVKK